MRLKKKTITDSKKKLYERIFKQKNPDIPVSQFTTLKELFTKVLDANKQRIISKGR